MALDLNPGWIGIATVENRGEVTSLADTRVLDHALIELDLLPGSPPEQVREVLAGVCERALGMARKHGAGLIVLESGLGKLRSAGRATRSSTPS